MKPFALALLLLCSVQAASAQTYLTVPGISYHGDRSTRWNEVNPGLGIEHDDIVAGYYRNSFDKDTVYVGYVWRPIKTRYLRAGLFSAFATGYPVPVLIAPTINVGTDAVSIDIIGAPSVGKGTTHFIGAQLRLRIW